MSALTCIIGGDSMVGKALLTNLPQPTLGTTRRKDNTNYHYLDLANSPRLPDLPIDSAVICAGITRLQACYDDPQMSYAVNVEGVRQVMAQLAERQIFTIYLSSDKVFDGSVPLRNADDTPCPITEYGRQKAAAEAYAQTYGMAILRLSKVFPPTMPLFQDWLNSLQQGESIRPFSDMYLAPLMITTVVSVVQLLLGHRQGGIWQLSGQEDIAYAELAYRAARLVGASEDLVKPSKMADANILSENPLPYTSLNIERLQKQFGVTPPNVLWVIDAMLKNSLLA